MLCPVGFFCPTGTANPRLGSMADDAQNRGLSESESNPYLDVRHLRYFGDDDIRVIGRHEVLCFNGIDNSLKLRHSLNFRKEGEDLGINTHNEFLYEKRDFDGDGESDGAPYMTVEEGELPGDASEAGTYRPYVINEGTKDDLVCARDHKWKLVGDAIGKNVCDCNNQFYAIVAVYRLWKCTASAGLENLGFGAVSRSKESLYGKRDFWFDRIHQNFEFADETDKR